MNTNADDLRLEEIMEEDPFCHWYNNEPCLEGKFPKGINFYITIEKYFRIVLYLCFL